MGFESHAEGTNHERPWERMGMRKTCFLILALVFVGSMPTTALSEDVFAPVKIVYMNDGKMIECQMGWLDGARMICRKFGGNMTLPLQSVDFEKTFPKYKIADGETVLLVHPGPRYQDENIVISNIRIVRASESQAKSSCVVVCEVMNRGDPCDVRVVMNALDAQGKILRQIDVLSESRLDVGESAILKRRLDGLGNGLENLMSSLKVTSVERRNVLESAIAGKNGVSSGTSQDKIRENKIKALKEIFLKERP